MPASVATLAFAALILGLFWLDRDHSARAAVVRWMPGTWLWKAESRAVLERLEAVRSHGAPVSVFLWLPVLWLSLAGSRSVSEWLQSAPPGVSTEALLEGDPINRLAYGGLVGLGLVVLMFRGPKVLRLLQANGPIVLFLSYCAISLAWAEYPDVGFKRLVKVVGDLVMVLIVLSERDPLVAIRRLLARTGFLLIPISVLMIKYYPDLARYYDRWTWSTWYAGVTTNKNALGVICMLFGLASVHQLLTVLSVRQAGRWRKVLAHTVMLVMVIWLLKLAHSMTALACFLIGIGVLVTLRFRAITRQPLLVHISMALLIAVPSIVLFTSLGAGFLAMLGKDPTLTDRTLIWDLLLSLTTSSVVGTGFENFWLGHQRLQEIWNVYPWAPNQAHNGYLEIYLNLGLVGLGLLFFVLLTGYQTAVARIRTAPIGSLLLAYFVAGIVFNFTEAGFFRISAPAWFVILLAMTKVPSFEASKKQVQPERRPMRRVQSPRLGTLTR